MATEAELVPVGEEIVQWLAGRTFGQIRVLDAVGDVIIDVDGYTAVDVMLTVSDPADETWPADDVAELHRAVHARALQYPEAPFVYLSLRPETEEMQADESETMRPA